MAEVPVSIIPVIIYWTDANEDNQNFESLDDLKNKEMRFRYVGFLVDQNDEYVTCVSHISHDNKYSNAFNIPYRMIDKMISLREGKTLFKFEEVLHDKRIRRRGQRSQGKSGTGRGGKRQPKG